MQVGDLIAYHHDREQFGLVLDQLPSGVLVVMWRHPDAHGRNVWTVDPKWCVMLRSRKRNHEEGVRAL